MWLAGDGPHQSLAAAAAAVGQLNQQQQLQPTRCQPFGAGGSGGVVVEQIRDATAAAAAAAAAAASASFQTNYCSSDETNEFGGLGFNTRQHNFSELEPLWVRKEWLDVLVRVSFVAPVVLLGIVGNLAIIWSICKFKSFRSKPTNLFILSMAIADLITALVCPLAALFNDIYQFYVLGPVLCRLEGSIKITCLLVSAYSLNWLSFIWLRYIVQPCRTRISIRKSWLILAGIWMVSVLVAAPLFFWRQLRSRQWKDLNEDWCCEMIHISKYYWVVITFIIVYLPTFFMTIVLSIILFQMDKFEAKLRRSRANQSNSSLTINMKYKRRIVKVLILYLLISIVCWAPFQFSIIYRHFRTEACLPAGYSDFVFASQLLASVPGALNPFVFGFLSQPFRKIVSAFWMFKFLDKLFIWRRSTANSADIGHQMDLHRPRGAGAGDPVQAANNQAANLHRLTSRAGSGAANRRPATAAGQTAAAAAAANTQRAAASQAHQHHHHHHQHRRSSTTTKSTRVHNNNNSSSKQLAETGVTNHHHHSMKQTILIPSRLDDKNGQQQQQQHGSRGCENAAYESTVGDHDDDDADHNYQNQSACEPIRGGAARRHIGTTSFIRQQTLTSRPMTPLSVVSMDSINIEENLAINTTIDEINQQQQQHQNTTD